MSSKLGDFLTSTLLSFSTLYCLMNGRDYKQAFSWLIIFNAESVLSWQFLSAIACALFRHLFSTVLQSNGEKPIQDISFVYHALELVLSAEEEQQDSDTDVELKMWTDLVAVLILEEDRETQVRDFFTMLKEEQYEPVLYFLHSSTIEEARFLSSALQQWFDRHCLFSDKQKKLRQLSITVLGLL